MTIDEITQKMERFDLDVRDRIDELMTIEARVDERVKSLQAAHEQALDKYHSREKTFCYELGQMKEMLSKFKHQHDEIIHTISKSKDFVVWSRRVLIYGVFLALTVLAGSGYGAYKSQSYVKDAKQELAELQANLAKTPVIYQDDTGVDVVRVKTNKDSKVKWKKSGKHKGAYAEIDYAR